MTRGMIIDNTKVVAGWLMVNLPMWIDSASTWITLFSTSLGAMVMVITYKRARIKLKINKMELEKMKKDESDK